MARGLAIRPPGLRAAQRAGTIASHAILIAFVVIVVYPVAWMVLASFKTQAELVSNSWGLPQTFAWDNYALAWGRARLGSALLNSVLVSLGTVALVTGVGALAGYALASFRFRFATAIFLLFVLTMQAPVPIIPLYAWLVALRMTDSIIGLVLPLVAGGLPLAIFIFRAYFGAFPRELRDAAVVDGCGEVGAFWRVVLPISGPAVATVAILQFLGAWNEYFLALILIRSPELRTLPLAIQVFFYAFGRTEWPQVFAALTVGSLPMIIVYVLMQRQFIQGLTAGAVRG
ncbi:MAG: carbohydrate ABC transporter permease [Chloroflexales bacterium]|nr:carbohydrate ABC transporter permease [Chloroflexales bacterium]